ncbi:glycine zipper 2TM domain-containing protein [bacterium]|nr:glycine zipper 2TM domain-containing protein [bacterium]
MSNRLRSAICVLLAALLASPGCAWYEANKKTVWGAGIGAAGGALIGGAYKGKKGAVWGGLLGALAGGAVGQYLDRKDRSAAETKAEHQYKPEQGTRLELMAVGSDPTQVAPGSDVKLQATYAVMAPNDQQSVKVTETRKITLNGQKVAETTAEMDRTPGTYSSIVPISLPPDTQRGTYQLHVTLAAAGQTSQQSSAFTVN